MATQRTWQHLDGRRSGDPKIEQRKQVTELLAAISAVTRIVPRLSAAHADQRIRLEAQFELARRRFDEFLAWPPIPMATGSRVHAIPQLDADQRTSAQAAWLADNDAEIRAQAAKLAGTRALTLAMPRLVDLLHDKRPGRGSAAMALGKGSPESTFNLIALSSATTTRMPTSARGHHGPDR